MVPGTDMTEFYRSQVQRIRELSARCTNPAIKLALFEIAARFEDRARESDRPRPIGRPG